MPTKTDILFTCFNGFAATNFGIKRFRISSLMTDEDEFNPDERLDIAAARIPDATNPEIPTGKPTSINFGNKLSACSVKVCPSLRKCGLLRKYANIASPTIAKNIFTINVAANEIPKVRLAAWTSLVDKYLCTAIWSEPLAQMNQTKSMIMALPTKDLSLISIPHLSGLQCSK